MQKTCCAPSSWRPSSRPGQLQRVPRTFAALNGSVKLGLQGIAHGHSRCLKKATKKRHSELRLCSRPWSRRPSAQVSGPAASETFGRSQPGLSCTVYQPNGWKKKAMPDVFLKIWRRGKSFQKQLLGRCTLNASPILSQTYCRSAALPRFCESRSTPAKRTRRNS